MNWFNINRNISIHGVINNFRMRGNFPVNFKIMHFNISGIHIWKSAAFVGGYNTIDAPTRMTWSLNAGLSKFSVVLHDMDKGTEYKVHLVGMTPRRD
jgi:hypothetical protein